MESIVHGISNRRELETDEKCIILRDTKSDKIVKIPMHIWIMLSRKFSKIEKAIDNEKNCFVHLDDGWCVSVWRPFVCVNIRRYYFASNGGLCPSRLGMSFKPSEWVALTSIADSLH